MSTSARAVSRDTVFLDAGEVVTRFARSSLLGVVLSLACTGCEKDAPPALRDPAPSAAAFECSTAAAAEPAVLRRLTMTQYRNTLRDLVRWLLNDEVESSRVLAQAALDDLPYDRREPVPQDIHGSYRRLDQSLEQLHVDGVFRVGRSLADALAEPERLARIAGDCAVDSDAANDQPCLTQFLERVGARILKRPLDAEDLSFYQSVAGSSSESSATPFADVMNVMLNAPEVLYFVEHGGREVPGKAGVFELTAYELASRLSYHFWQTSPDAQLWQAASDGTLLEPATYAREVGRLASDPRTQVTMAEFFADWLKVDDLAPLGENQDPVYLAFAEPSAPTPELRQHMIDDVLSMVAYYTWTERAGVPELFTSELSFARDPDLAAIYGVAAWDGVSAPPQLPPGARPGLLTRALFLANGSANTRPIMKGVFIRRRMLCDDIPPPPAGVNATPPELRSDMTTRQVVESITEQPGSACAVCHAALINPLGFATEGFDALGRTRSEQALFAENGAPAGSLPVDTHSIPRVTPDDGSSSAGPADLAQLMLQSGKLEACLARNYFRFTYGRWENSASDGCVLERLRARLVETGSIAEMLKEVALTPEFRQRRFE
jgi:Protein of unknown function (DUF1592)/Protein of unknown function (DUF1588)/Protein of unknown function (DUF1585)